MTRLQRRHAHLFSRYRLSGSALPFDTWVKHDHVAQAQAEAIALPKSFWWVTGLVGTVAILIVGGAVWAW